MPSHSADLFAKYFRVFVVVTLAVSGVPLVTAYAQRDNMRIIVSDDFTRNRPGGRKQTKSARQTRKGSAGESPGGRDYRLASQPFPKPAVPAGSSALAQLGLTIWKLRRGGVGNPLRDDKSTELPGWIAERVEADTVFHEGDYLRLSIESPRTGYLYVIDRDWFADGDPGETSLVFPIRGDNNRLYAGRLIDIPAADRTAFRASPKPNQLGEILTIIVTSKPLTLPLSEQPIPISNTQLSQWEEMWRGWTERFEMQGGAGQPRTLPEELAAARKGERQLTRNDPAPQTIYRLIPKSPTGLLFDLRLSYLR